MEHNRWLRALIVILVFISGLFLLSQVFGLLGQFSSILVVLFLAWLLAFILSPIHNFLMARGLARGWSVGLVYLALLALISAIMVLIIPLIVDQFTQLGKNLPGYFQQFEDWLIGFQGGLQERGINLDLIGLYRNQDWAQRIQEWGGVLVTNSLNFAAGAASVLLNAIVVLVISFYFVIDGPRIMGALLDAVPDAWHDEARYFVESVGGKFGGFLRGQLLQAVLYAIAIAIVTGFAGLDYVLVVSLTGGLLMFIPFFGPILGFIPPIIVAAFSGSFATFIIVVVLLFVVQQIITNVIAPKVMADAVGMHPVLVFLAILLGIQLAGPLGAVFGVPVIAVINSMILLYYNRSETVSRHRAVRLGLASSCEISPRGATPAPPGPTSRWGKAVASTFERFSSLVMDLWRKIARRDRQT